MLLAISCTGKATPSPLTIQIKTPLFVAIIGVQKGVSKRVGQFPSEKPCIDACSKKGCLLDRGQLVGRESIHVCVRRRRVYENILKFE